MNMMNMIPNRRRVYRKRHFTACPVCCPIPPLWEGDKPWMASTEIGTQDFATWREAYEYASRLRLIMMNN